MIDKLVLLIMFFQRVALLSSHLGAIRVDVSRSLKPVHRHLTTVNISW